MGVNLRYFVFVWVWVCEERQRVNVFKVCANGSARACGALCFYVHRCRELGGMGYEVRQGRKMQLAVSSVEEEKQDKNGEVAGV